TGVAGALARGGPDAIALLTTCLKDEEPDVRKTAVRSLQSIVQREKDGEVSEAALAAFKKAMQDEAHSVRLAGVQAVPFCGPAAVPVLVIALDDKDVKVRANAAAALSRPAYKTLAGTIAPALARRLKSEDEIPVKQSLLSTLGRCGPEAVPAIRE